MIYDCLTSGLYLTLQINLITETTLVVRMEQSVRYASACLQTILRHDDNIIVSKRPAAACNVSGVYSSEYRLILQSKYQFLLVSALDDPRHFSTELRQCHIRVHYRLTL